MIIELRFLQVLISPLTGDRVTVGMLHWDGSLVRTAHAFHALPPWISVGRDDLEATVRTLLRDVARHGEKDQRVRSLLGLADLAPLPRGLGAALLWTDVHRIRATDPESSFEAIAQEVHLTHDDREGERGYARAMRRDLIALGRELADRAGDRIRVSHPVGTDLKITPPLSWQHLRWHHALPLHLHRDRMERPAFQVAGQIVCAVPEDDIAVVVVDAPEDGTRGREARQEIAALRKALPTKRAEVLRVHGRRELQRTIRERVEAEAIGTRARRTR